MNAKQLRNICILARAGLKVFVQDDTQPPGVIAEVSTDLAACLAEADRLAQVEKAAAEKAAAETNKE